MVPSYHRGSHARPSVLGEEEAAVTLPLIGEAENLGMIKFICLVERPWKSHDLHFETGSVMNPILADEKDTSELSSALQSSISAPVSTG